MSGISGPLNPFFPPQLVSGAIFFPVWFLISACFGITLAYLFGPGKNFPSLGFFFFFVMPFANVWQATV
eukprot:m.37685 g.37685  ORF g.37685 m.37685 type:complete len:69 (+) comp11125_c0_seq1:1855-2061(+)